MTLFPDTTSPVLTDLGWSPFFAEQIEPAENGLVPMRIATVHRSRLIGETGSGQVELGFQQNTGDFAVGDWVLIDSETQDIVRRLDRKTVLRRRTENANVPQLIAANVDTLFIVTSCNDDFNLGRLERYLALANEAGANPVVVLTKVDQVSDAQSYRPQVEALQQGLDVVLVNAKSSDAAIALAPWCGPGQTVALVGSSGVGKSTLLNILADKAADEAQPTGGIREHDSKGRHTTTSRSLHAISGGGWVIDTPGMRTLHVGNVAAGLDVVFAEINQLALKCRFRDCTHAHEPGCAVQSAVADGTLSAERLGRWRKLHEENSANTPVQSGPRGNKSDAWRGKRR